MLHIFSVLLQLTRVLKWDYGLGWADKLLWHIQWVCCSGWNLVDGLLLFCHCHDTMRPAQKVWFWFWNVLITPSHFDSSILKTYNSLYYVRSWKSVVAQGKFIIHKRIQFLLPELAAFRTIRPLVNVLQLGLGLLWIYVAYFKVLVLKSLHSMFVGYIT